MDTETFKQRYLPLNGRLYMLALRMLGSGDDARDAVQDIYLKLWEMRGRLDEVERSEAFVVTLMRNHCLDVIRCRHTAEPLEACDTAVEARAVDPEHAIDCRDRLKRVVEAIENLPQAQRQAITMRDIGGYEMKEIEDALDVSADYARTLLSRARRSIRKLFVI